MWTRKTFEIEVQLKLGQSACVQREDAHINKTIFITSDNPAQVLLGTKPVGFTRADLPAYYEHHAAFTNLGRSALADVRVHVCFVDVGGKKSPEYEVQLGSIRCPDEIHVAVYISKVFSDMKVLWDHATEQHKTLLFYAVDHVSAAETSFALPDATLELPGMTRVDGARPE